MLVWDIFLWKQKTLEDHEKKVGGRCDVCELDSTG